jgi:hypothetical protein
MTENFVVTPMEFSVAQYEAVVKELQATLPKLEAGYHKLSTKSASLGKLLLDLTLAELKLLWEEINAIVEAAIFVVKKLGELAQGVTAPLWFFKTASEWFDVRGQANGIATCVHPAQLYVGPAWHGMGADVYKNQIALQTIAVNRVSSISDKVGGVLNEAAGWGLAFYSALALTLGKFAVKLGAALLACESLVGVPAAIALAATQASLTALQVTQAVGALAVFVQTQEKAWSSLHGEAMDNNGFPDGRWPVGHTDQYSSAVNWVHN